MPVLQGAPYAAEMIAEADLTGSTVTLAAIAPNGTTTSPTVTTVGKTATATVVGSQVGTYLLLWTVTGALSGVVQDQFTVEAAALDLISLSDLRDELNIANTSKDAKLRRWLKAATEVVENVTGPIRAHTTVDLFDGGTRQVVLSTRWVSSITSVVDGVGPAARTLTEQSGSLTDPYGYSWDRVTNTITRRTGGGGVALFQPGPAAVTVTYVAGLTTIPADIQLATAELIKHWYRKSEVPGRGAGFGAAASDDVGMTPGNYMLPNAVMELLDPWRRPPEVA